MTSRDQINPSELPTDSLDNAFEDSNALDLNSDSLFNSAAGPSGIRSGNNDPINDTVLYEDQDLEGEKFISPSESLTEDNLNSDNPFTDDNYSRESSGQRFISFEHLSNSLPLQESANDVETSLSESLISKYETFLSASLQETPFNETEAYQLKEMAQISSSSTAYEDSCCVDFGPSTSSGSGDNVSEREKSDIKMAGVLEETDILNSKNLKTEYAGNGEDSRSFEQSKFETPKDCNFSDHSLNSENKSLHKQLDPEQNTTFAGAILPQNIITRNDASGGGSCLLNASNTVDENDSNLKMSSEFASNERNSDSIKEVGVHGNPLEIRKHHDSNSVSNNNTDTQPPHLSVDELYKYLELKTITNNFFKPCQLSSLHEDQRKETFLEAEAEIKTTNIPSLIRDSSSIDKGAVNNNYNDNPQNTDEPTEDCKFEHQILNMNENVTAEISSTSVQDIANSNLTNKSDSGEDGNTAVISKTGVNNNKTYDFDNSSEGLLLNEFNCDSGNLDSNKTEFKFSLPRMCSLETKSDNFPTGSKTPDEACLEKETHMPVQCQKNSTTHAINNIFREETNGNSDCQQIFNTECQNVGSASTSNLSSIQFMNITTDYRQNANLFENMDDSPQNNNEPTVDCKFEHQILNMNENVTAEISSTSVRDIANSNLTNKSDSGKDGSTTVISKTEIDDFSICSQTPDEACLEKETHIPVQSQKNSTTNANNNISLAETNGNYDCQQIFNTEFQNIDSASTSGLNSVQFLKMTSDYRQNAGLFENMDGNFAVQGLNSNRKQTTEVRDENIQRNSCIFEPKPSSKVKCSSVTNANTDTQSFINESKITENYISSNNGTSLFEKNIDIKNPDKDATTLDDSKSREQETKNARNTEMYEIIEHSSESLHRRAKTPDFKNDEENTISFESSSIPPSVSESTKAYIAENKQFDETCHLFESSPLQESKSTCASDSYEGIMKSQRLHVRLEDIKYKLTLPPVEELVSQDIILRRSQRLLNLSNSRSNTASAVTTANHKDLNNVGTEKQTSKRTSTEDQTLRDCKKLKSCKVQPKSLRTTPQTITKGEFVPTDNSRKTVINSDIRSTKEESISSSFLRMAEVLRKYDNKRQEPSTSKNNEFEFGPRIFNDKGTDENSSLTLSNSGEGISAKEESTSLSSLRMPEVLRKYDNKRQEPSTSKNNEFEFGPRIFNDKGTDENSSLLLGNSGEGTSAAQTVFDITVTAVKQLNNGNGSTVLDIVSYVRTNLNSSEKKLSQDVRKALKDATAARFLTFANGKYKKIPKLIEENTSKEAKRKTTRESDNSKTMSKRLKPTPTAPAHNLRPKTTHLTRESFDRNPKNDSRK